MKFTALLPMKAHSERVKDKNIRDFCGKPMYHAICITLEKCDYISEIIINTDSEYILNNASNEFSKVKTVKRPENICGDFVSMNKIIEYDLGFAENEHIIQTHSTNPLLALETLNKAIDLYLKRKGDVDSVFSVTRLQNRLYDKNVNPINHNPGILARTQDLAPIFEENSNFYIFSKKSFKIGLNRIGRSPLMFEMNKLEAVDIDTEDDFTLTEILCKRTI